MQEKVLVIGLDGATFDVIRPMIEQNRLPNIAGLIGSGVHGKLTSTIPPHSPVAWSSFVTGKNPGKHGVYYFLGDTLETYNRALVSSKSIRTEKLWQILSRNGKRVGIIDVPLTYPPDEVNGFMISGMLTPSEESIFTYPANLHTELIIKLGDYPLEERVLHEFKKGNALDALKQLYYLTNKRRDAAFYLMHKYDWDFFMIVFRGTDLIQHVAFKFWDKNYCKQHELECTKFGEIIFQFYEKIDAIIGDILTQVRDKCTTIIMSDHGMRPVSKHFFINKWLIKEGFLRLKRFYLLASIFKIRNTPSLIDWSKTKAFSSWAGGEAMIRINLAGREPCGSVKPGREYEQIREQIIDRLYQIKDPDTGNPIIEKVYKKEEIYSGPFLREAPDLQIVTNDMSYHPRGEFAAKQVLMTPQEATPGMHHIDGILIMNGPPIRKATQISGARIIDLAPTILYLLNLPIPDDVDGRVLFEALK